MTEKEMKYKWYYRAIYLKNLQPKWGYTPKPLKKAQVINKTWEQLVEMQNND